MSEAMHLSRLNIFELDVDIDVSLHVIWQIYEKVLMECVFNWDYELKGKPLNAIYHLRLEEK